MKNRDEYTSDLAKMTSKIIKGHKDPEDRLSPNSYDIKHRLSEERWEWLIDPCRYLADVKKMYELRKEKSSTNNQSKEETDKILNE